MACALGLAACAHRNQISPDYGEAFRLNETAQAAHPALPPASHPPPGSDGTRAALAQHRYVSDKVQAPAAIPTSSIGEATGP